MTRENASSGELLADGARLAQGQARLNSLLQFITENDGLDIHFAHVRSRHPHALPMIITHGWSGSVIGQPEPGRLCAAWGIDRRLDGIDLCQADPRWLESDGHVLDKMGRASGSALRAGPTVRCAPTFGANGSSAVRRHSTSERPGGF